MLPAPIRSHDAAATSACVQLNAGLEAR